MKITDLVQHNASLDEQLIEAMRGNRAVAPKPIVVPPDQVPARLFHGTTPHGFYMIMKTNSMDEGAHWNRVNEPHGPRFTDNMAMAKDYAKFSPHTDDANGVILELDGKKLAQKYKIVRYQDVDADGDLWAGEPYEFVPLTKVLAPIKTYLVQVHFGSNTKEWFHKENPEFWEEEFGIDNGNSLMRWLRREVASSKHARYQVKR